MNFDSCSPFRWSTGDQRIWITVFLCMSSQRFAWGLAVCIRQRLSSLGLCVWSTCAINLRPICGMVFLLWFSIYVEESCLHHDAYDCIACWERAAQVALCFLSFKQEKMIWFDVPRPWRCSFSTSCEFRTFQCARGHFVRLVEPSVHPVQRRNAQYRASRWWNMSGEECAAIFDVAFCLSLILA